MIKICKYCSTEFNTSRKEQVYCKAVCRTNEMHDTYYNDWLSGTFELTAKSTRKTIRRFVLRYLDHVCSCCGISEWNDIPIVLEVEHIDGDSSNNAPENLQLLCPTCNLRKHAKDPIEWANELGLLL